MSDDPKANAATGESDAAFRRLVDLFENQKGKTAPYRVYRLERIEGALVFRQTEADAIVENALRRGYEPTLANDLPQDRSIRPLD